MFDPSNGLINIITGIFGLPRLQWIGSIQTAMLSSLLLPSGNRPGIL